MFQKVVLSSHACFVLSRSSKEIVVLHIGYKINISVSIEFCLLLHHLHFAGSAGINGFSTYRCIDAEQAKLEAQKSTKQQQRRLIEQKRWEMRSIMQLNVKMKCGVEVKIAQHGTKMYFLFFFFSF